MNFQLGDDETISYKDRTTEEERTLHSQLITSSWCGLIAALTPLIDAATDESVTENVLKAMQNYTSICGTLGTVFKHFIHCKRSFNQTSFSCRSSNAP